MTTLHNKNDADAGGGKRIFSFLCSLSIAGLFVPINFSLIGFSSLSYYLQLVGLIATVVLLFSNLDYVHVDLPLMFTLLFCTSAYFSTCLFGDLSTYYVKTLIFFLQTWAVANIGIHRNPDWLLQCFAGVLGTFIIMNFAFMLINYPSHPLGFSDEQNMEMWLLGHKNQFRNWMFPFLTALSLLDVRRIGHLAPCTYLMMAICVVSVGLANSATSTTLLIIYCILLVLYGFGLVGYHILNSAVASIVYVTLFFIVVILRKIPLIGDFVTDVLNRDLSFTGRSEIWDTAIRGIIKNPVFGVGYHEIGTTKLITPYNQIVTHAHEALLDTIYKYGFVGLFLSSLMGILSVLRLYANRKNSASVLISVSLACYLVCGVFGELYNTGFYFVLCLGCYCSHFSLDVPH